MSEVGNSHPVAVVRTAVELGRHVAPWREAGERLALVPTMGALHDGHLSLIDLARSAADRVIVSIFVNPAQFGAGEDFDRYPRAEGRDLASLAARGADLAYLPSVEEIYPGGARETITVPAMARALCDAHRPGHFAGVAAVVARLLRQCAPDVAVFGQKDYQQLIVIRQLVADLGLPVEVLGAPIVRDGDGLALSSRNAYLSPGERRVAITLNRVLHRVADDAARGADIATATSDGKRALADAGFDAIDYLDVRDPRTLLPVSGTTIPARVLAAVRIGKVRLIDNVAVSPPLP